MGNVGDKDLTRAPALEKVWRKMDLYVLPVVAMFYLLSFLVSHLLHYVEGKSFMLPQDRTNFGNARVAGLQKDLKLTNKQYSIALTVTYVPYIFAELPSNLLLKVCECLVLEFRTNEAQAVGPDRLLPVLLTLWGIVTTSQGSSCLTRVVY